MEKQPPYNLIFFWVDEKRSSFEEFFETVDQAFYENAEKRQKVFDVLTLPGFPERIYLSLN